MVHTDPEILAGLALGDSDDDVARRHVASCAQCAGVVDELRRVADLTREGDPGLDADGWQRPPAEVWSRITDELDAQPDERDQGGSGPASGLPSELPSELPAVRRVRRRAADRARRTSIAWLAAACAAGVLVGVGGAWSFWRAPTPSVATTTTVASVPLDTLDTRTPQGRAVLERVDGGLDLRVDSTSLDPGSGFLEVWLLNADGKRMVSLGMLRQPGSTFPVSQAMLDKGYVIVDVSREAFDDRPQHSGDSLLRGRLSV